MQLTTGGGKTVIFTTIALNHIANNPFNKCLVLTDRTELLKQAGGSFSKFNTVPELISPGHKPDFLKSLFVGMVETVSRRRNNLKEFLESLSLVIIDEAHKGNFAKILPLLNNNCIVLGATATPLSTKKHRLDLLYSDLVQGVETNELINLKYLCNYRHFAAKANLEKVKVKAGEFESASLLAAFEQPKLKLGLLKFYKEYAQNKKTLIFCVNIQHAHNTTHQLKESGFNPLCLTSKNTKAEREQILNEFESDEKGILVNCGILTTGYDCPSIECIILNRATLSLPLYLQMIGRGSRTAPNKDNFIVIDMGGNGERFGLWNAARDWSKFYNFQEKKKRAKNSIAPVKLCPKCDALNSAQAKTCEECGFTFPIKHKKQILAERLEEITPIKSYSQLPLNLTKDPSEMSLEELILRAQYGSPHTGKPYKLSWIVYQLKQRPNKSELIKKFATLKGYSNGWIHRQLNY